LQEDRSAWIWGRGGYSGGGETQVKTRGEPDSEVQPELPWNSLKSGGPIVVLMMGVSIELERNGGRTGERKV